MPKHLQTQSKVFQKYRLNLYSLNPITFSTGPSPHSVEAAQNVPFDSNAAPCANWTEFIFQDVSFLLYFKQNFTLPKDFNAEQSFMNLKSKVD